LSLSPLITDLVSALQALPGVGPKGAQRMALHLLQRNREGGATLADSLSKACEQVGYCDSCRTLSETRQCGICADSRRDATLVCVVESPADILAIEAAGGFSGHYFVLHGHLSPIDGVGPKELGLPELEQTLRSRTVDELILATNPTVEGEATAHYISQLAGGIVGAISRIAHGVPVGGELEYVDGGTIVHALAGRRTLDS